MTDRPVRSATAESETPLRRFIDAQRLAVDAALDAALPDGERVPASLHAAMRHSVFAGGKRLRPLLVLAGSAACGGSSEAAMPAAVAVELIHTYSLIHDDLPAFDDEALRRGQPTCHVVFGEAVAILAGDALQALAFETLARAAARSDDARAWALAGARVGRAAGSIGMCGGQTLDIEAVGNAIVIDELRALHAAKTGALLTASVVAGGLIGGADEARVEALETYGDAVGLAFQVVDDLLDVEGDAARLGKTPGGDATRGQPTFPALIGVAPARDEAAALRDRAIGALAAFDDAADPLRGLAALIVDRDR